MKLIAAALSMTASIAFASQARYSFEAKCYVVDTDSSTYKVHHFGPSEGLSDYSCKNAYDNLVNDCNIKAQAVGYVAGSVYKDILVVSKEGSQSSSKTEVNVEEHSGARSWFKKPRKTYRSMSESQTEVSKTEVDYIRVDKKRDCEFDANIPKQNVPSVQSKDYGE